MDKKTPTTFLLLPSVRRYRLVQKQNPIGVTIENNSFVAVVAVVHEKASGD